MARSGRAGKEKLGNRELQDISLLRMLWQAQGGRLWLFCTFLFFIVSLIDPDREYARRKKKNPFIPYVNFIPNKHSPYCSLCVPAFNKENSVSIFDFPCPSSFLFPSFLPQSSPKFGGDIKTICRWSGLKRRGKGQKKKMPKRVKVQPPARSPTFRLD